MIDVLRAAAVPIFDRTRPTGGGVARRTDGRTNDDALSPPSKGLTLKIRKLYDIT